MVPIIRYLLNTDADINTMDTSGETAADLVPAALLGQQRKHDQQKQEDSSEEGASVAAFFRQRT